LAAEKFIWVKYEQQGTQVRNPRISWRGGGPALQPSDAQHPCQQGDALFLANVDVWKWLQVDIVVDETYALNPTIYNISTFLTTMNLTSADNYTFLTNKAVYRYPIPPPPPPFLLFPVPHTCGDLEYEITPRKVIIPPDR